MKISVVKSPPVPTPPDRVVIELEMPEAQELYDMVRKIGVQADVMYGPVCTKISDEEQEKDPYYNGHTLKYKRLTDKLYTYLSGVGLRTKD